MTKFVVTFVYNGAIHFLEVSARNETDAVAQVIESNMGAMVQKVTRAG